MRRLVIVALVLTIFFASSYSQAKVSCGVSPSPATFDYGVSSTEIVGLRIGMTPRRIAQEVTAFGWTEDKYSTQTLEDIIQQGTGSDAHIGFNIAKPRSGVVLIHFCNSKARFIRFESTVGEDESADYMKAAKLRLQSLGNVHVKQDELSYSMSYSPNSQAFVSFTVYKVVPGQRGFYIWEDVADGGMCQ
jgi:hypothetical protein